MKSDKKKTQQFYYFAFPTIPQQTNPKENHLCVYMLCMFVYLQKSKAYSTQYFWISLIYSLPHEMFSTQIGI